MILLREKITKYLKQLLTLFICLSWKDKDKIKILIQNNKYFEEKSWSQIINNIPKEKKDKFEFKFSNSKLKYYKLSREANIIFAFHFNTQIIANTKNLAMFYLALRGAESIVERAEKFPFKIYTIPPLGKEYMAEFVLMNALILMRNYHYSIKNNFKKEWNQSAMLNNNVTTLRDKIIGIAGLGAVGTETARLFKDLGCFINGWDKQNKEELGFIDKFFAFNSFEKFIASSDIIVLTLPLTKETENLFREDTFSKMKKGSYLINVSRGKLVNEDALINAINHKVLRGAALDVFKAEPLPPNNKLWDNHKIIISPHIAGNINLFIKEIQHDFLSKLMDIEL